MQADPSGAPKYLYWLTLDEFWFAMEILYQAGFSLADAALAPGRAHIASEKQAVYATPSCWRDRSGSRAFAHDAGRSGHYMLLANQWLPAELDDHFDRVVVAPTPSAFAAVARAAAVPERHAL